jgi:hypothetical protein
MVEILKHHGDNTEHVENRLFDYNPFYLKPAYAPYM